MRHASTWSGIFTAAALVLFMVACQGSLAGNGAAAQGASGQAGPIQVSGAWARISVAPAPAAGAAGSPAPSAQAGEMPGMAGSSANGAAYMTIRNTGTSPDRLLAAQAGIAAAAEIHTTTSDGGIMRMSPVEAVDLPAGADVTLQSGGLHVMLIGISRPLATGETFELTLRFERAGNLTLRVLVRQP